MVSNTCEMLSRGIVVIYANLVKSKVVVKLYPFFDKSGFIFVRN